MPSRRIRLDPSGLPRFVSLDCLPDGASGLVAAIPNDERADYHLPTVLCSRITPENPLSIDVVCGGTREQRITYEQACAAAPRERTDADEHLYVFSIFDVGSMYIFNTLLWDRQDFDARMDKELAAYMARETTGLSNDDEEELVGYMLERYDLCVRLAARTYGTFWRRMHDATGTAQFRYMLEPSTAKHLARDDQSLPTFFAFWSKHDPCDPDDGPSEYPDTTNATMVTNLEMIRDIDRQWRLDLFETFIFACKHLDLEMPASYRRPDEDTL